MEFIEWPCFEKATNIFSWLHMHSIAEIGPHYLDSDSSYFGGDTRLPCFCVSTHPDHCTEKTCKGEYFPFTEEGYEQAKEALRKRARDSGIEFEEI